MLKRKRKKNRKVKSRELSRFSYRCVEGGDRVGGDLSIALQMIIVEDCNKVINNIPLFALPSLQRQANK